MLPPVAFYRDLAAAVSAGSVVDLGCGTGQLAVELARRGHRVTGIDPSPAMLALRRQRDGGDRVRWVEGDASCLGSGEYDLVVMSGHVIQIITDNDQPVDGDVRRGPSGAARWRLIRL
jgi:ubiquinone/menaquinone biosynthesis C-methylase UbiE